jgi:tetratricopeptide (TPR) repeat protein
MTRVSLIVLLSFLAACGSPDGSRPGNGQPGLNVASAALAGGSPDIALNVTNGILAKEPDNVPALLSQADAFNALNRSTEAKSSYARALVAEPGSVAAQIGLARLALSSDPEQAQGLFLTALAQDPGNKIALNDLGIAYDLQGEHAKAQDAYRRALGADPSMRAAEVNLALSMALNGQAADAVRLLKPFATDPSASRRLRQDFAAALAISGDKQQAAKILSVDMTPEQTQRALLAYGEFGR